MTAPTEELREKVRSLLLDHKGSDDPITSREISEELGLDEVESFPTTRGMIRDVIEEDEVPIAASGSGYFVIETEDELEDYLDSLNERMMNIAERRYLVRSAAEDWHGFGSSDDSDYEDMGLSDF